MLKLLAQSVFSWQLTEMVVNLVYTNILDNKILSHFLKYNKISVADLMWQDNILYCFY